jgi:hypothetical protein
MATYLILVEPIARRLHWIRLLSREKPMTSQEFRSSLKNDEPPSDLPPLPQALWWDAKGNWVRAHEIAQEIQSEDAAWVHAYLHHKEGDTSNAQYWYSQAGKPFCSLETEAEWLEIVDYLLKAEFHT